MGGQLPGWLQVLTALLTPAIAIAVGIIGYLQWRTAHLRVVLDLFDRRRNLFYAIVEAVNPIVAHAHVGREDSDRSFTIASRDARFLFGDDVNDYLEGLRQNLLQMRLSETMIEAHDAARDWVRLNHDQMLRVLNFYDTFPALCDPYLRLDQKRVRPPVQWIKEEVLRRKRTRAVEKPTP